MGRVETSLQFVPKLFERYSLHPIKSPLMSNVPATAKVTSLLEISMIEISTPPGKFDKDAKLITPALDSRVTLKTFDAETEGSSKVRVTELFVVDSLVAAVLPSPLANTPALFKVTIALISGVFPVDP